MSQLSSPSPDPAWAESDSKRERILAAAEQVCARRGFAAARMEEVAALARVSKGTLYHYFASKDDLFLAMILESFEEGRRLVDARMRDTDDPAARLEQLLAGLADVLARNGPRAPVQYQAWAVVANDAQRRDQLYAYLRDFFDERGREVAATIRAGQAQGCFGPEVDVDALATAIPALLSGFIFHATFDPGRADPATLRAAYRALVDAALRPAAEAAR